MSYDWSRTGNKIHNLLDPQSQQKGEIKKHETTFVSGGTNLE